MADAADKVVEDDERAMALLQQQEQQRRDREALIAESMHCYDPTIPLYCDDCDEQIDPERLAAYPKASRCTTCATAHEKHMRARWPQ